MYRTILFVKHLLNRSLTWVGALTLASVSVSNADDRDATRDQRLENWRAGRFGMFIHWGPYAVLAGDYTDKNGKKAPRAGEWIMRKAEIPLAEYEKVAMQWKAEKYDPQQWVDFAKRCGVRYMVITAKHHDGFALFDSKVSRWNAVQASGAKRDLLRPLADACKKSSMPLGFHYSQAQDWYHAGGGFNGESWDPRQKGDFDSFLRDVSLPQFRELMENYGPVHSLFADTPLKMNKERALPFHAAIPSETVLNDRLGGGRADYWCNEEFLSPTLRRSGDWEFCTTMNGSWGYSKEPTQWKSREQLLTNLITTVSRGGNFLLNVGPVADGTFPPQAVERFEFIGRWLSNHGDSIYDAGACSFIVPTWNGVSSMRRDKNGDTHVYLHFLQSPKAKTILLPRFANELVKAEVMRNALQVDCKKTSKSWELTIEEGTIKPFDVVHLQWKGSIQIEKSAISWDGSGILQLKAGQAKLHGKTINRLRDPLSPEMNIGYWTDLNDNVSWSLDIAEKSQVESTWNISCKPQSEGAEVGLYIGEKELAKWTVQPTKSWHDYQKMNGPSFELPAGKYELTLKALSKPGVGVMNLSEINIVKSK